MALNVDTIPFARELGIEIVRQGRGRSELRYAPRSEHGNSLGVVHGGALMTLLDVSMAVAALSDGPEQAAVTVEMKTSFMRGVRWEPGRPVVGRGRLLRRTRGMAFVEARVFDADGEFSAHATGTFKYVHRKQPSAPAAPPSGVNETGEQDAHQPSGFAGQPPRG